MVVNIDDEAHFMFIFIQMTSLLMNKDVTVYDMLKISTRMLKFTFDDDN